MMVAVGPGFSVFVDRWLLYLGHFAQDYNWDQQLVAIVNRQLLIAVTRFR